MEYSSYKVFKIFGAMQMHFTSGFDYAKYGCNVKTLTLEKFNPRRRQYEKLYDMFLDEKALIKTLAPVFYHFKPTWVGEAIQKIVERDDKVMRARATFDAPVYYTIKELKQLQDPISLYVSETTAAKEVMSGHLSPEAAIILDKATGILNISKKSVNIVDKNFTNSINRYATFVDASQDDLEQIRTAARKYLETFRA